MGPAEALTNEMIADITKKKFNLLFAAVGFDFDN